MVQQCDDAGLPRPFWKSDPKLGVTVTFTSPEVIPQTGGKSMAGKPEVTPEVTPEVARMLRVLEREMNRTEIMNALGLNDEKHFREHYQQTAVAAGLIEMTIPDKPRSSKQRYRLTAPGKAARAKSIRANP